MKRRSFLKCAVAAPVLIPGRALGQDGPAPSERVNVGIIGLGGRSRQMVDTSLKIPEMRIAAVCDCFKPRVDSAMAKMGEAQGWKPYTDFRAMIEKENLDAVMVETTSHARAWITCHAMAMGMDVYIEKPMSITIAEGRDMVNVARKYKRVTQVGTQQRSIPLNKWACELVKDGGIGTVRRVLAPDFIGPDRWTGKPEMPMPEGGEEGWWDIWTNQAEFRPYHKDLHRGWARWWAYDGGGRSFGVSGWGTHSYDQIQPGLDTNETGPVEVTLEEALEDRPGGTFDERQPEPSETGAPYYGMVRNVHGLRAKVRMKFESGVDLELYLDADRGPGLGCIFEGDDGRIEVNRDCISANPEELILGPNRPAPLSVPETQPHIEDWLACIKTREKCSADIEYGQRSSTLCHLVNIVRDVGRVGETLAWDPAAERFKNCDEGNAMLARTPRKGYELPT